MFAFFGFDNVATLEFKFPFTFKSEPILNCFLLFNWSVPLTWKLKFFTVDILLVTADKLGCDDNCLSKLFTLFIDEKSLITVDDSLSLKG